MSAPASVLAVTPLVFGEHGVYGGAERYVHSLARAVAQAAPDRFRVSILGFSDRFEGVFAEGPVRVTVARTENPVADPMQWRGARLWQMVGECDLVHVHQPFTPCGELALIAAAECGKPSVATDAGGRMPPSSPEHHAISLAGRLLALSRFSLETLRGIDIPAEVISGPVSAPFLEAPLRERDKRGALFVGRIAPHKGVDRLVRAAPADLPVTIAGRIHDGEYAAHLHALAAGKDVTFLHEIEDALLPQLLAQAAVHVAPSVVKDYKGNVHANSELMGIATLEALACGTPVLVADTCSLPELIEGGKVGEVFSSEAQLRDRLHQVRDGAWAQRFSPQACRAFAAARFAPAVVGARTGALYSAALEAGVPA